MHSNELAANELDEAEIMWNKYLQNKHYLTRDGQLSKEQKQNQLNPTIQKNGIIRLSGRMVNAELPEEAKLPILLPRTEHFTKLLITDIHKKIFHSGVVHTLSQLRTKY